MRYRMLILLLYERIPNESPLKGIQSPSPLDTLEVVLQKPVASESPVSTDENMILELTSLSLVQVEPETQPVAPLRDMVNFQEILRM